jgi:hypothetical protein
MKSLVFSTLITQAISHAIWQDLWVNGVDKGSTCVRLPGTSYVSNSPVTVSPLPTTYQVPQTNLYLKERIIKRHPLQRRRHQRSFREMSG